MAGEEVKGTIINIGQLVEQLLKFLEYEFGSSPDYIVRENTVSADTPRHYNIASLLRRPGRYGYLISDEGTIKFSMNAGADDERAARNTGATITLYQGERYPFDDKNHEVFSIHIETASLTELAFRLVMS